MKNLKWLKPAVKSQIKKLDKEIERLYKEAEKIQEKAWDKKDAAKKLRHQRFYLLTGTKVGGVFEYKKKLYRIDSTSRTTEVDDKLRGYPNRHRVTPYLIEFLSGKSSSPFKLIPTKE